MAIIPDLPNVSVYIYSLLAFRGECYVEREKEGEEV